MKFMLSVNTEQFAVPAQVAADKLEGWRESKKRKGEGGKTVTKGVACFSNLSVYKEKYSPFGVANMWGVGVRVMSKNSWSSLHLLLFLKEQIKDIIIIRGSEESVGSAWESTSSSDDGRI
jgi:hypothetical protein